MENKLLNDISKKYDLFRNNLNKYEQAITDLLGNKFGITPQEFIVKTANSIKKTPELLKCSEQSLFGSILYFAEIGLPFNTPEGFGYISSDFVNGTIEATPIIGYRGLIEIAYRNPRVKSVRIQAVYDEDVFDYEYGTSEYIRHKPKINQSSNRKLIAVYAIVKLDTIDPLFVVVHKSQLDELKKISKSANNLYAKNDIFNIMESKVAIKLLFKTLPKVDNETLIKVLEMDNRFDYEKNIKIEATEKGYKVIENENKNNILTNNKIQEIEFSESEDYKKQIENKIQEIEFSENNKNKNELENKLNDFNKNTFFEWNLNIDEEPFVKNKTEKIERTSRWHPEFLKQLKPIEIPEIETPKTAQKLTPKTEKQLLEGIIEVIEIIDLTKE